MAGRASSGGCLGAWAAACNVWGWRASSASGSATPTPPPPLACSTAVLNDFEAVGYSIPALQANDMVALNDVKPVPMVRPPRAPTLPPNPHSSIGIRPCLRLHGASCRTALQRQGQ